MHFDPEKMQGYNAIVVFDKMADRLLMCKRSKAPYKGLLNFVGGKIEKNEDGIVAAYRELEEETAITSDDIELSHLMDFTYYWESFYLEIYVGRLTREVSVHGDENELVWVNADEDFFDTARYAGDGNIGHIMRQIAGSMQQS